MKIALLLASIATSTTTAYTTGRRVASITFAKSSHIHMSLSSSTSTQKQALISCPTTPLRDGTPHPVTGFGTYKVGFIPASASAAATDGVPTRTAAECVSDALDCGYRFLEWYVYILHFRISALVGIAMSHIFILFNMIISVPSFMEMRQRLVKLSKQVVSKGKSYFFVVKFGLLLLKREKMQFVPSWIRHLVISERTILIYI